MKIAFIGLKGIPGSFTGIETYVEEIGSRLAGRHELWAYCRPHYVPRSSEIETKGIKRIWLPSINTKHLDASVHSLISTLHSTFKGFDIYHFQALGPSAFSIFPRLKRSKIVVTVHGLDWARAKWGKFARLALRTAERAMVKFAGAVIVVSRTLEKHYLDTYGVKTFYIPNGVYEPKPRGTEALLCLNVEPKFYLLFMARLTPEKGAHLLIEAFRNVKTDAKLVVEGTYQAGERWYYEKLKALSENDPRIIFAGWVSGELKDALLQHALAFVQPSTLEGLSIGLLEAAASGALCLASDIPENKEVLESEDRSYQFFFKNGDVKDLRFKIEEILEFSEHERKKIAAESKEHVLSKFNWDVAAQKTEAVYNNLLNR